MQDYACGCKPEPTSQLERCDIHGLWSCHLDAIPKGRAYIEVAGRKCPPCFRADLPTVGLLPGISRLKYERIKGHPPEKRKY